MTSLTARRLPRFSLFIAPCSLIIIGLILVAPLLQSAPLQTDDGGLHIFRTIALDRAIQAGLLYPRWFPDLAFGYGFPFFNYREPLGYYALELLYRGGLSIPLALNLTLAASVILSGLATMWWVSDIFDQTAGFFAGIIYMSSPYILIGPIDRANLPEVIALALLPLILFCFRRLITIGGRKYFIAAVASYCALLLTHNISSLIFTPLLIVYCLLRIPSPSLHISHHAVRRALLAIVISLALTSFFWLPALAEGSSVQLNLTHTSRGNDYHNNFLSLGELFDVQVSDPNLLNPPALFMLGWPQIVLAVLGLMALRRNPAREQRAHLVAAIAAALAFIFMTLPISLPIWDHLPLIRFVQFTWRFVGRAMLPMSLLGGAAVAYVLARVPRRLTLWLSLILAIIILIFATPFLYPRIGAIKSNLTISDVFAFEHDTGMIGVDPVGAYLPVTVQQRPEGSPLEAEYQNGGSIQRFDRSTLPQGASLSNQTYGPNRASIDLTSPIGFSATYLTFDFPGWQVSIDQQPISIVPSDPNGLITFNVPAGQHHIEVSFGSTPIRSLADIISVMALLAFVIALIKMKFQPAVISSQPSAFSLAPFSLLLIPIIFLAIKLLLIDTQLTPFRSTRLINNQISGVSHPLQIDYGNQVRLLGYDLSSSTAPSGGKIRLDLYWQAQTALQTEYQTTAGVIDDRGEIWSPKSLDRPRDFQDYPPTTQWPTPSYAIDSFELPINPGTPPGALSIFAEVFNYRTWVPLAAQTEALHPAQRPADAVIGSINVLHSTQVYSSDQLGIYNLKLDQLLALDLKLLGANRDRDQAAPGDSVLLTLFWQAIQEPAADYSLKIELIDSQNQAKAAFDFPLGGGRYPTSNWNANEQIVDLDRVRVPLDLSTGTYHWRAALSNQATVDLGPLNVSAPDRSFAIPTIPHRIDQTFDDNITLLGYNIEGDVAVSKQFTVTLYWRAEAEMDASYKVFVHLLDANNQPRAQADAIPVNGARPTIGWLPGEILTDTYTLSLPNDLPAGAYHLATGWYNADDLARLKLANGDDSIVLQSIDLAP